MKATNGNPTVSIKFPIRLCADGFCFVDDDRLSASNYYGHTLAKARKHLALCVESEIEGLLTASKHKDKYVIGCVDGTVLFVRFQHGGWGYEICGPGRSISAGCLMGKGIGKDSTIESARKHAEQSYGGIAWQHSVI